MSETDDNSVQQLQSIDNYCILKQMTTQYSSYSPQTVIAFLKLGRYMYFYLIQCQVMNILVSLTDKCVLNYLYNKESHFIISIYIFLLSNYALTCQLNNNACLECILKGVLSVFSKRRICITILIFKVFATETGEKNRQYIISEKILGLNLRILVRYHLCKLDCSIFSFSS